MRPVSLRWLLGIAAVLAFVLTACSSPATPQTTAPDHITVGSGDLQTDVDLGRLDLEPLSFWHPPTVTCQGADGNTFVKSYAKIIVWVHDRGDPWYRWYPDIFWIPQRWEVAGGLVLYAHGYIAPDDPGFLVQLFQAELSGTPSPELQARDALLCKGSAVAASSYSKKGWAEARGTQDTARLADIFNYLMRLNRTERDNLNTYMFGASLGGLITVHLAENANYVERLHLKGAMPLCGPIGGSLLELNYIGNVRLAFDHFLTNPTTPPSSFLGGTLTDPGPTLTDAELLQQIAAATTIRPDGVTPLLGTWLEIASIGTNIPTTSGGVTFADPRIMPLVQIPVSYGMQPTTNGTPAMNFEVSASMPGYALFRALRYDVRGALDILSVGGGWPMDTTDTLYGLGASDPWLPWPAFALGDPFYPDGVAPTGSAIDAFYAQYQPSGDTKVPLLTLHTAVDPDVPLLHELVYANLAASYGGDMVRSYVVPGIMPQELVDTIQDPELQGQLVNFGHCNFQASDLMVAFSALKFRAQNGTWPTDGPMWQWPDDFQALDDFVATVAPALQVR